MLVRRIVVLLDSKCETKSMMPLGLLTAVKAPGYVQRSAPSVCGTTLPHQTQDHPWASPFQALRFPEALPEFGGQT